MEREAFMYRQETRYRDIWCIIFPDDRIREAWDIILTL